jgi:large subunit ribosomal protein L10
LAISKNRKQEVIAQYAEWLAHSRAIVVAEYTGLTMKEMDDLRAKVREAGGEFHVVKNTLVTRVLKEAKIEWKDEHFSSSSAIGFAFKDAPALAKTMTDYAKGSNLLKIKGGYLGNRAMSAEDVKALADMPPLPVMRATLLGTILAPASQLARLLAEPGRQVAAVIKAYADNNAAPEAA